MRLPPRKLYSKAEDAPLAPECSTPAARFAPDTVANAARSRLLGFRRPPLWFTLAGCAVILFARRPAEWRNPQFWAEDGAVFFQQAWSIGWRAIVEPYAGYLTLAQRLVAAAAVQFDPLWSPAFFVTASAALMLYVATRTQSRRFLLPAHPGYAFAVVLVPDTFEVLLILTNIQWVVAGALLALLASADARRWWQHAHDAGAALVCGLTGPFSLLFAPLFAWRAWRRRTVASAVLAGLISACGATQLKLISAQPLASADTVVATERMLAVPGMRVGASLLTGGKLPVEAPVTVQIGAGVLTLVALALLALRPGNDRVERVWLLVGFVVVLGSSLYRCRHVLPGMCQPVFGARYVYLPQLVALWLLIAAASGHTTRWKAHAVHGLLGWILVINLPRLREPALFDCQWPEHARRIRAGEAVTVPINPAGWTFSLPAGAVHAKQVAPE